MSNLKLKETGHERYDRLNLGKPHIAWCPLVGAWIQARASVHGIDDAAIAFCVAQKRRWTPRSQT